MKNRHQLTQFDKYVVIDGPIWKRIHTNEKRDDIQQFHMEFNKKTGFRACWGKTKDHDPDWSPYGPELLDIEITTSCAGPHGNDPCPHCYKANTLDGTYMPFDMFVEIFDKVNYYKTLTQIAFGIDATATSNPDLMKILEYTRRHGVIPNLTCANLTREQAKDLAGVCGAVAVSRYADKDICYDTVHHLLDVGLKIINIHCLISTESKDIAHETIRDYVTDNRLKGLTAIVLLSLKQKGRGEGYHPISQDDFITLIRTGMFLKVPFGFDSCTRHKAIDAFSRLGISEEKLNVEMQWSDPCESGLLSLYCDTNGIVYPCSFTEKVVNTSASDTVTALCYDGISLLDADDFIDDVWLHPYMQDWRSMLLKGDRHCPVYTI